MLMISPHIAFNIPFDLLYDICYPLHVKTHFFLFSSDYCQSNCQQFSTYQDFDLLRLSLKI